MSSLPKHNVRDLSLASTGQEQIAWAGRWMPVLALVRERFAQDKPLDGVSYAGCAHITAETANLALTLRAGGADVALCASNPLSTQDEVAASLVADYGISVYAKKGESVEVYSESLLAVLGNNPQLLMDDGGDLVATVLTKRPDLAENIIGVAEETTTGVLRLRNMEKEKVLKFPVLAVNGARTKYLFDNRYGTGQSTIDGILRATNVLIAGKVFVVAGYGWCSRGIAMRAQGMGARVIVTEVNPLRALEAVMDGFQVLPMAEAAQIGDIFVTATGNRDVINAEHIAVVKDGALLCNAGHFDVEVDVAKLRRLAIGEREIRPALREFQMEDGRRLYLLGEGRLVNLASAEGHPASVMDMSFANQALGAEYLLRSGRNLEPAVYDIPSEIDNQIASLKLETLGIVIDHLTPAQAEYINSWQLGT